jgi:hypothetical protein
VGLEAVDRRVHAVVGDDAPAVALDVDPRIRAGRHDHAGAVEPVALDEAVARALLDVEVLGGRVRPEVIADDPDPVAAIRQEIVEPATTITPAAAA